MLRHYSLSTYFRQRFGRRVRKVPLDAGATCPNRDGTLSSTGCSFCNEQGSGTGLFGRGVDLEGQWRTLVSRLRDPAGPHLAYLQSFSNTYCPATDLAAMLARLAALPGLAGVAIGTRPDCLDEEKLDVLAGAGLDELWLDLGLQSSSDATLERVNRGHGADVFARIVEQAAARGIRVCAHLIAGLPGEGADEFVDSVRFAGALPIAGIKLHNLYICENTNLAADYRAGTVVTLERDDYVTMLARALENLRPQVVVHRLASDPAPGELVAPDWAARKMDVLNRLSQLMAREDTWQGRLAGAPDGPPAWFAPDAPLPPDGA